MKRYISSILIPCLLLQLFGCYSYRAITLDELRQYPGENNIRILKDTTQIIINRKISIYEAMDWNMTDSSILVNNKIMKNYMDTSFVEGEKLEIPCSKIGMTEIEEIDYVKTAIFSAILGVVILFAIAGIGVSQNGIDLGLDGKW